MSRHADAVERFLRAGTEFGLVGPDLKRYVDEQIEAERLQSALDRDERTRVRVEEREAEVSRQEQVRAAVVDDRDAEAGRLERERTAAAALHAADLERQDRELAAAAEQRAAVDEWLDRERAAAVEERADAAERELRQQEHELAMRRLEIEGQVRLGEGQAGAAAQAQAPPGRFPGLRLPFFDDKTDSIDSFLHRFEIFATSQAWPNDVWAQYLSSLLKGRALETYTRMPVNDALDYPRVKDALLRRFELTESGFKSKFYETRAEPGESPRQVLARLDFYLMRWAELAGCPATFDGLKDFFLREQYLTTCSQDLTVFIRERKPRSPRSVEELSVLAESFLDARDKPRPEASQSQLWSR